MRFGLTDRDGVSALDEGRARSGTGYDELHAVLERLLAGGTRHAGALLGPFGVRFVIAEEGDLPPGVAERLSEQLDLDRVPAGGLTIFRNAAALPTAFVSANAPVPDRADPAAVEASPVVIASPLDGGGESYTGTARCAGHTSWSPSSSTRAGGSRTAARCSRPSPATAGRSPRPCRPGAVDVHFTDQWLRTVELYVLALLWVVALWVTRKPGSA